MSIISIENLTKVYKKKKLLGSDKFTALNNLSFEVRYGEIFGYLGPNGSGKTTTIKLLLGLLFPTSGSCRVFDAPVPSRFVSGRIGYISEMPYFHKYLTTAEILELYGDLSSIPGDIVNNNIKRVLEVVKMSRVRDTRIGEFSKGMLQRIGVAQALLHDPELLILDEPFTGLDPLGLKDMREIILNQRSSGKTVFFSSHIISEAEKICDRVGILHNGRLLRIVEIKSITPGTLEDIFVDTIRSSENGGRQG